MASLNYKKSDGSWERVTGGKTGVLAFNGRVGGVTPKEGDYTAEMVGARPNTWMPNIAEVGGTNHNLLRNWYFINPVNQRGLESYGNLPSGGAYTIDGWRTNFSGDTISLASDGIKNLVTSTTEGWHLYQIISDGIPALVGSSITASFLVSNVNGTYIRPIVSFRDANDNELKGKTLSVGPVVPGLNVVSGVVPDGTAKIRVGLYAFGGVASGDYVTMLAAKLEIGTTQTLAHNEGDAWILNEIPNYNEGLIRCSISTADPDDSYANGKILHTNNLVRGHYTGSGQEGGRQILVGGISDRGILLLSSENGVVICTDTCSIGLSKNGNVVNCYNYIRFRTSNGQNVFAIAAPHDLVDAAQIKYTYQLL